MSHSACRWDTFDGRLAGTDGDQSASVRAMRMKRFEAQSGYYASRMAAEQDKPVPNLGNFKPGATQGMPAAQSLEGATVQASVTGTVEGEAKITVDVKPSQYFAALVQRVEQAVKLIGSLSSNGLGSTGRSSPDANPFPGY